MAAPLFITETSMLKKLCTEEYRLLLRNIHDNIRWGATGVNLIPHIKQDLKKFTDVTTILDYGSGCGRIKQHQDRLDGDYEVLEYDPGVKGKEHGNIPADYLICCDVLEHIEPDLIRNVLEDITRCMKKGGTISIAFVPAKKILADGRNAHLIVKDKGWWNQLLNEYVRVKKITLYNEGRQGIWYVRPKIQENRNE